MNYRLINKGKDAASFCVAEADLANNAAALEWAASWLQENAASDGQYFAELTDGSFTVRFIRTAGAEWYAIGQPVHS